MKSYFIDIMQYERWANTRLFNYLKKNGDHDEIRRIFSHLLADMVPWVYLMQGEQVPAEIDCEPDWPLSECKTSLERIHDSLNTILSNSADDLLEIVESPGKNGMVFSNTRVEVFTHLAAHSQHHRGQIGYIIETELRDNCSMAFMRFLRQ